MRRTKEEAEQTRNEILNAAATFFAQKGVGQTSLQEIAEAAGVTRGAIYWHFKNKLEIFEALNERLYQPFVEMIMQDMQIDHPDPLLQMQELCINLLTELEDNQQKRLALTIFIIKQDYSGDLAPYKTLHDAKKAESLELFSRYFHKAQKKGALPANADIETLTFGVSCYMKGILVEYLGDPDAMDIKQQAPKLIKLFFKQLKP